MSKREKLLDDIAQLAGGAIGMAHDTKSQIRDIIRTNIDAWAQDMDLVPRQEFERIEAMLITAREEQEELKKRLDDLEQRLGKNGAKND